MCQVGIQLNRFLYNLLGIPCFGSPNHLIQQKIKIERIILFVL